MRFISLIKICVFYSFVLSNFVEIESVEVGYGDPCDADNTCKSRAFLKCDSASKTCVCENPDQTMYDEDYGVCKLKLNQVCSTEKSSQMCQPFSFCKASETEIGVSRCLCETPSAVESRGQCFLSYNESCYYASEIGSCDTESFMKCDGNNRCTCDTSTYKDSWYEKATKSCVILQGDACKVGEKEQKCVESAKCEFRTPGVLKCVCQNGVDYRTLSGQCVSYYGEECNIMSNPICKDSDYLTCKNNKCECSGDNTWYDTTSGLCTLVAGSECKINGQSCTPLASCSNDGVCTCAEGLTPNRDKQCFLSHGADCNKFNLPKKWECDKANDLRCNFNTNICECNSPAYLHFEDGVCKLKALSACDPVSPTAKPCINNSHCGPQTDGSENVCTCNEPLNYNDDFLCVRKHNVTCGADLAGDCDADTFHKCIDGRCACSDPENMILENYSDTCRLKMGAPCKTGAGNPSCTSTLSCEADGKCGCSKALQLEDNGLGKCKKLHGTKCDTKDYPEGFCDTDNYLMCYGGKCVCDDSHRTKEEGRGKPCVGNKNAACRTDANCNSSNNLICKEGKCTSSGAVKFYINALFMVLAVAFSIFGKN